MAERGTKRRREGDDELSVSDRATLRLLAKVPALNGARPGLRGRRGAVFVGDFSSDALVDALGESFATPCAVGDQIAAWVAETSTVAEAAAQFDTRDKVLDDSSRGYTTKTTLVASGFEDPTVPAATGTLALETIPEAPGCEDHLAAEATIPAPEKVVPAVPGVRDHPAAAAAPTALESSVLEPSAAPTAVAAPPRDVASDDEL